MSGDLEFKKKAVFFLVKFFAIYAVLQFLILVLPLGFLENGIAIIEASALGASVKGNIIEPGGHFFQIVPNCTGLVGISVLASILFALHKPKLKKKFALLAIGALILFPLNLLRVYLVIATAMAFNPNLAEMLHISTWFISSAAILIVWYYLTKKVAAVKNFSDLL